MEQMNKPTINLPWNLVLTLAITALQIFAVQDLIESKLALKWMLAVSAFFRAAQVIMGHWSNQDGTPQEVAYVPKDKL